MRIVSYKEYIEKEELKRLMKKNDALAAFEIFTHWLWIAFAFAIVAIYPNPITIIISLFILGGKQLGCAILMHDSGHYSVFSNKKLNNFIGKWFGAYPIINDVLRYRPYHNLHHAKTGLEEDPDILLTRGYPTTKKSMIRKVLRDLLGITGIKAILGLIFIHVGILKYNLGNKNEWLSRKEWSAKDIFINAINNLSGPIAANFMMFLILWSATGSIWIYFLWPLAYITTFQIIIRVRSISEHAVIESSEDPYKNTRTTHANFLEQLLFAPYHVNFHAEHHMLPAVPSYNLKAMNKLITERGFYKKGVYAKGYLEVLRLAVSKLD